MNSINLLKRVFHVLVVMAVLGMNGITEMNAYENNPECRKEPNAQSSTKKKAKSDSGNDAIGYTTDEIPQDKQTLSKGPRFQGGDMNAFSIWVNQHLRYPESLRKHRIHGKVVAEFKINSDGRVSDVKIISGVCPDLDNEVIRVLSSSPKFKPAIKDGKPVAVAYTFPVIFALR